MSLTPGDSPGNARLATAFLTLAVLAVAVATLRPAGDTIPEGWSFSLVSGDQSLAEIIENLLLFIPFGAAVAWRGPQLRWWAVLAAGLALSFTVEFLQQWIPGRDPSVGDLLFNTLGTTVGVVLVRTAPRWLLVSDARATWLSLGTAMLAATVWLGTGWLLDPLLPDAGGYQIRTRKPGQHMDQYSGHVLSVTGRLGVSEPLHIVVTAGPPSGRLAPILDVVDAVRPAGTLVAADRQDLVLRNRSRSMLFGLDRPTLRARGAFDGTRPGDTLAIVAWTDGKRPAFCLAVDDKPWCGLGYTMGNGWQLIFYPEHFPAGALDLLNACWIAGWTLGIGWWSRRHAASGAALGLAIVVLLAGPRLVGLLATPLGELVGGVAGVALGRWARTRSATASARSGTAIPRA